MRTAGMMTGAICALGLAAAAAPTLEGTKVLSDNNFDSQMPGTPGKGFTAWGGDKGFWAKGQGFYVSNVASLSPTNSFVIDYRHFGAKGPGSQPYVHYSFGSQTNGWQYLSFAFMKGPGDISFEVRGGYTSPMGISFWGKFSDCVGLASGDWKAWSSTGAKTVLPNLWHRLHIWLPPPGAKEAQGWIRLDRYDEKGVATAGEMCPLKVPPSQKRTDKGVSMSFNGIGGNRLFLDDMRTGVCVER